MSETLSRPDRLLAISYEAQELTKKLLAMHVQVLDASCNGLQIVSKGTRENRVKHSKQSDIILHNRMVVAPEVHNLPTAEEGLVEGSEAMAYSQLGIIYPDGVDMYLVIEHRLIPTLDLREPYVEHFVDVYKSHLN